jgi:threonine/homoserine/homoserine lactone efflux protein
MLTQAIGAVLPFAVGVALSPIPIIAIILVLDTPKARTNGPAFAVGWIAGLVIVSVTVLLLASGADDPDSSTATGVNWFQVAIGLLFVSMAMTQWRKRPRRGETPEMPKWMATVDRFAPGKALVLGVVLSGVNPKNLALTAAADAAIAQAGLSAGQEAIAVAVFVVLASVTVVGPVIFYLVAREKAAAPLASVKDFMTAHSNVIMMVLLLVIGAKVLGDGLGGLAR